MRQATKLKICNWSLLTVTIFLLVSAFQLELTGSSGIFPVWIHVAVGSIFSILVLIHVYLHFKKSNWFAKFQRLKKPVTQILWYLFLLTDLLGLIAFARWLVSNQHSVLGGVHGKIGFLMLAVAIGHIIKRFKFFRGSNR